MKLDSEQIYSKLISAGEDWADADAAATLLEETRKSVLAELMVKSAGITAAAKEMFALADPGYRKHIEGMVAARKVANRKRVYYDSAKTLSELRRSEESTRRAEILHA